MLGTGLGQTPDSVGGWVACPPHVVMVAAVGRRRKGRRRGRRPGSHGRRAGWYHLAHTGYIPLLRSVVLGVLWAASGRAGPMWLDLVPWGLWVWQRAGVLWPRLRGQPEWQGRHWLLRAGQRWLMVGYPGLASGALLRAMATASVPPAVLAAQEHVSKL